MMKARTVPQSLACRGRSISQKVVRGMENNEESIFSPSTCLKV